MIQNIRKYGHDLQPMNLDDSPKVLEEDLKALTQYKFITQPTLTPVDTVVKAIDDLTCALKGARNTQGMQQIERLKMIDELLNKIPSNLTEMSDPSTKTPIPKVTRNNVGASSKGAKRK